MSKRKPHNEDLGYVAERVFRRTHLLNGSHIVIYIAEEQGIDVDHKYAIVCSEHATITSDTSIPKARLSMKYPEFCEACMSICNSSV